MANLGLLIIRLVVGITFFGHGGQKLFGWAGGPGPTGMEQWLESLGIKTGSKVWGIVAGVFELVGGVLFATGEWTSLGAALIIVIMVDAIVLVHGKNGFWAQNGGFEYNVVLIAVVVGVAFIGPGDYVMFQ